MWYCRGWGSRSVVVSSISTRPGDSIHAVRVEVADGSMGAAFFVGAAAARVNVGVDNLTWTVSCIEGIKDAISGP